MPAAAIHLCIAKKLLRENLDKELFYVGNIAPDSWRNSNSNKHDSHFEIDGKIDYMLFYNKYKDRLDSPYVLGYFIHLITDKYWYKNELSTVYYKHNKIDIYNKEISKLVCNITKYYDIEKLNKISNNFDNPIEELETKGINDTIDFINKYSFRDKEESKILKLEDTIKDIDNTCLFIESELKRLGIH